MSAQRYMRQTHNSNFEDSNSSPKKMIDIVARSSNKKWMKNEDIKKSNNRDIEDCIKITKKKDKAISPIRSSGKLEKNIMASLSSEEGPRDFKDFA